MTMGIFVILWLYMLAYFLTYLVPEMVDLDSPPIILGVKQYFWGHMTVGILVIIVAVPPKSVYGSADIQKHLKIA